MALYFDQITPGTLGCIHIWYYWGLQRRYEQSQRHWGTACCQPYLISFTLPESITKPTSSIVMDVSATLVATTILRTPAACLSKTCTYSAACSKMTFGSSMYGMQNWKAVRMHGCLKCACCCNKLNRCNNAVQALPHILMQPSRAPTMLIGMSHRVHSQE